jgi:hypothetical protein
MTLDRTTLKVGDTISVGSERAEIVFVGKGSIVVAERPDGSQFFPTLGVWSVVPPVPPCPITRPLTIYAQYHSTDNVWATGGANLPGGPSPITIWPPGEAPDPSKSSGGIWTWDVQP